MVIWGDHLWHGSVRKETDGLRLTMLGMYNRPHMATQEGFRDTVTDEALARNPMRFTRLMKVYHAMPMGTSGAGLERVGGAAGLRQPVRYGACRRPRAPRGGKGPPGVRRRRRQRPHGDAGQGRIGQRFSRPVPRLSRESRFGDPGPDPVSTGAACSDPEHSILHLSGSATPKYTVREDPAGLSGSS